jgi:hypothetical protein
MIIFIHFPWKTYNPPLVLSFFVNSVFRIPTEYKYDLLILLKIPSLTLTYKLLTFQIQNTTFIFHCRCSSKSIKSERIFENFVHVTNEVYMVNSIRPSPNSQTGGPFLVGRPLWLILYIRIFTLFKEAVSSIRNLKTGHIVVTGASRNYYWKVICTIFKHSPVRLII